MVDGGRIDKEKQLIGHILLPLSELDGGAPDEEPQLYKLDIEKVKFIHRGINAREITVFKSDG